MNYTFPKRSVLFSIEVIFHIVFWVLILHFMFDIERIVENLLLIITEGETLLDDSFIFILVSLILFYFNIGYLMPKYLNKGKWVNYSIGIIVSFLLANRLSYSLFACLSNSHYYFLIPLQSFLDDSNLFYLFSILSSIGTGITKMFMQNLAKKIKAEEKQKEAELKYLANQFNPHFLHNTLNGIYGKAIEENASETTEAILRLSEIMRYPINKGLKKQIPLVEEILFIENYIALQQLRLGENYPVSFEKKGTFEEVNILPLSLIVLVENAFKYGVSQKNKPPITFRLISNDQYTEFTAINQVKNNDHTSSHKVGLSNLEKRLDLLYSKKHTITTHLINGEYIIKLRFER